MRSRSLVSASRRRVEASADSYVTMFYAETTSGESPATGTRKFYVDSTGSNANAGTATGTAWQNWDAVTAYAFSPGFQAGDRILFRRGQNHVVPQWNLIEFSGASGNPITIGAYGSGTPPAVLMSNYALDATTGRDANIGQSVFIVQPGMSYIVIRDLLISSVATNDVFEAGVAVNGTNVTIDNCEISQASNGVIFRSGGSANGVVKNCYIHDTKMQRADAQNPDDDFGCYGVISENTSDINIHHNTFKNIKQTSPDYGLDGNCLEVYASSGNINNVIFQNNYIEDCLGVCEFGGTSTRTVSNVIIDHNIICNVNSLLYFHVGGTAFALSSISNVKFQNNTVYCDQANSGLVVDRAFGFSSGTGAFFTSQNNIFSIANMEVFDSTEGATLAYAHTNNLYDLGAGVSVRAGYTNAAGEYVGIPAFVNVAARDFRLNAMSGAVGRAASLAGYLTDYAGRSLDGRPNLDIGAVESDHEALPATATATLTELPSKRVFQRIGTTAPITLSGVYTGTPAAIQARTVNATDNTEISRWVTVSASPTGGTWTGTLTVPQGGWHKIQVRPQSAPGTVSVATNTFGVGDIWLFVGQSQQAMMSWDSASPPTADDRTVYFNGTDTWASPGVIASTNGNGGIRYLNLMRVYTGVPQAIIQSSVGETAITDWEEADPAYTAARDKLIAAGRIAGILWNQGGTGIGLVSRTDYKTRLENLRTRFQAAATVQNFGVYPLMHRAAGANTDLQSQETRRAHYEHISENPGTVNLGWEPGIPLIDNVHTTPAGSELIAYQYASAWLYKLGVIATNNIGPSITSVTRSAAVLTLTVQHTNGTSLKINSGTQATGFQVFPRGSAHVDANALAISSVALGTNTITITLASDPSGAVDVYYQYGNFDNTSPVYDNATILGRTVGNALQPLMSPVQSAFEAQALTATNFDGTDTSAGRVTFADSASFDMQDASWTLGFMVKASSNAGSAGNYIFSTGNYQAANSFNLLFWEASSANPNGVGLAFVGADATTYQIISPVTASGATSPLFDGTWRLWTIERVKGTGASTVFNIYQTPIGANQTRSLVHTATANALTTISPPGGASGVPTLAARALSSGGRYLNGTMYLAFQMDGVLTATETQNLAAGKDLITNLAKTPRWYVKLIGTGPTFTDLSGNGNTATVAGTVTQTTGPAFPIQASMDSEAATLDSSSITFDRE